MSQRACEERILGRTGYGGPCPGVASTAISSSSTLSDSALDLPEGSTKADIEIAMNGHVIASGKFRTLQRGIA